MSADICHIGLRKRINEETDRASVRSIHRAELKGLSVVSHNASLQYKDNAPRLRAKHLPNHIPFDASEVSRAQIIVDRHYGFGFIVGQCGRIIAANETARRAIYAKTHLKDISIDQSNVDAILSWLQGSRANRDSLKIFDVSFGKDIKAHWFISPVNLAQNIRHNTKRYFLMTSAEAHIDLHLDPHIADYFDLTRAETDVTNALCNGLSPKAIAWERGVKITAVRTQIARIKEKLGANDIPDIIRIISHMVIRSMSVKAQESMGASLR